VLSQRIDARRGEGAASVAFPAISTGVFGYPMDAAAEVAFRAILEATASLRSVKRIRFVLFASGDLEIHARALAAVK